MHPAKIPPVGALKGYGRKIVCAGDATTDAMIDPATSEPPRKNVQLPLDETGVTKPSHTSTPAVEASDPDTVV